MRHSCLGLAGVILLGYGGMGCTGNASDSGSTIDGGGAGGAGLPSGSGGRAATSGTGGASSGTGGSPGSGGSLGTGGTVGTGGAVGAGGRSGTGGATVGGADASVGRPDAGGSADAASDVNQNALPNVTLHLAGDSTVMTYLVPTATADEGWGQELGQFLIPKVAINNQAIGGATVQSFHASGRWTNIISALKAGDYVMADFGINDSSGLVGRSVTPAAFQTLFGQMADEVKAKQATFIMVTPSALQYWSGGVETNARLQPYVDAMKTLAPMKSVLVDDLNARSVEYLNMIGQTAAMQIYKALDKAHFTMAGATQMAKFVAEELRRIGSPLAAYLK